MAEQRNPDHYLVTEHLIKRFDEALAVDDVNLGIRQGEIFALLGSSGCGKSTLLRMLAGFEKPTAGRILMDGQDVGGLAPYERPFNMMFQSYALFPHLNIWDNVAFGLKREGLPKDQIAQRVGSMLELVQLEAYGKRLPHQLSGGQQQRVALARSLAKRPKVLLLDEPLGALDKKLRERTQFELVNIIRQVGVTCVMVTHDQEEAMTMANRIAVMSKGRVLQVGSAEEVYEHPVNRFVADFIGNVNLLDGHLSVDEADHCAVLTRLGEVYVGHGISGALRMPVSLAIRPEKIEISRIRPQRSHNVFAGVVREIAYLGAHNSLIVECEDGTRVRITEANTSRHDLSHFSAGEPVFFGWSDSDAVVLRD